MFTHLHFIGICGISMSSLAIISAGLGYTVSGSDSTEGQIPQKLINAGITVYRGNSPENLPHNVEKTRVAVIYSAAIGESNIELSAAREAGFRTLGRAEFLAMLTKDFPSRIGVAGMHGKSTVCAMLAEIFKAANADPDVLCGAEAKALDGTFRIGAGNHLIYEACEYKDSFLHTSPTIAVITNIEPEHLDYFRGIEAIRASFLKYVRSAEGCIINIDSPEARMIANLIPEKAITCSIQSNKADFYAVSPEIYRGIGSFKLFWRGIFLCDINLRVPGRHNISNALIAAATAIEAGISPQAVEQGLSLFSGVRRRMEYRGELNGAVIYDDYAHHPTEIRATLAAAREMGFRFISCAFQPHTYSRTAAFFCDFANAFGDADEVIFADIYAAREENVYGITSRDLATVTKKGYYLPTPDLIAAHFKNIAAPDVMLLTMGAGELNRVPELLFSNK